MSFNYFYILTCYVAFYSTVFTTILAAFIATYGPTVLSTYYYTLPTANYTT